MKLAKFRKLCPLGVLNLVSPALVQMIDRAFILRTEPLRDP